MERRKFLLGVGSLTAASAAAMGTGAFSYVRADRNMSVNVKGDSKAYLKLASTSEYASENSGQLELEFDGSNDQNGKGLNKDADSRFDKVFEIKNQGTNDVRVSIQDVNPDVVGFYEGTDFSDAGLLNGGAGNQLPVLEPGESIKVSMIFWLRDDDNGEGDIPDEIGIVAEQP